MKENSLINIDISEFGFIDDTLETKNHHVTYIFYDIGRLIISSKEKHGGDEVYIEDFFTVDKFINIIYYVTGHKILQ